MARLNEAQHNSLAVGLRALSHTCNEIERLLSGEQPPLLWEIENDLTEQERQRIATSLTRLRHQIQAIAAQWAVKPEVISVRRSIVAQLSVDWSDLNDLRPHTLRRYGEVDPAVAAVLQPAIEQLIATVQVLLKDCQ
jgi:hypothetical protein